MIRVRVYETMILAKRGFIEYCEHNTESIKLTKLRGVANYVPLVVLNNDDFILFMSCHLYNKWCKGKTYYDDFDKCFMHSGYKVSNEIAENILNNC